MQIETITKETNFPSGVLQSFFADKPEQTVSFCGNSEILSDEKIGFFCSSKSSGAAILKVFERANRWRKERTTIISGFHSPLEREVLEILIIRKGTNNHLSGAKHRNNAPAERLADSLDGKSLADYLALHPHTANFADDCDEAQSVYRSNRRPNNLRLYFR